MPTGLKIKVPGGSRKIAQPEPSTSRKKRRVTTDEDLTPITPVRRKRKRVSIIDDDDVEEERGEVNIVSPERLTPNADAEDRFSDRSLPEQRSASPPVEPVRKPDPPSRKRNKRKRNTVLSEDEDESDVPEENYDNDDDDFAIDSPPQRKKKKGTGGTKIKGKSKGGREKGRTSDEIPARDQRKFIAKGPLEESAAGVGTGTKRRKDAALESQPIEIIKQADPVVPSAQSVATPEVTQPPKKKLPTIKKYKHTSTTSSNTVPSSSSATRPPGASSALTNSFNPTSSDDLSIVSKTRKPNTNTGNDLDLSRPDVYASLFKTIGTVNEPRTKEQEEKRKRFLQMRDEEKAARMAALRKGTFDLLAGQEKVSNFENKLRERNSPALYPNHLASAIKHIAQNRKLTTQ